MGDFVLENVCLCANVRNEFCNAAGGIADYVDSLVPYVGAAVIVDNFSVDGTREVLSDMEERYHNLRTFEREFDGFGNNRSFALEKGRGSKLRYALFLDADERLSLGSMRHLKEILEVVRVEGYSFVFNNVEYETGKSVDAPAWSTRVMNFNNVSGFSGDVWELPVLNRANVYSTDIVIDHFLPSRDRREKKIEWYKILSENGVSDRFSTYAKNFMDCGASRPFGS